MVTTAVRRLRNKQGGRAQPLTHEPRGAKETVMRVAAKRMLIGALILSLSGAAYAQGAGAGGATGGGNAAGQGGTGMGTPNTSGATGTPSGASGANTMGTTSDPTQKNMQKKQKKGAMDSPASGGEMKKAY
jgi:hypothetical protein